MRTMTAQKNGHKSAKPDGGWAPLLEAATRDVFHIMLGTQLEPPVPSDPPLVADLTSMVGLAGDLCGVISFHCRAESASLMASKMLGMEISGFDDTVRDAIGEICNVVAGNFKAKVAGLVNECMLSVPSVISGSDYKLFSLVDGERSEVAFSFEGTPVWVTLDLNS